ncbi:MAG: glycoside hydrolase family 3 protein [Clostridia bacterium]|nr:glycoside hydrolase family 3 protein [Clostridia bacterium]
MKKVTLSELTLREKIGQTAALRAAFLTKVEDVDDYIKNNPYGILWTQGNIKMDFVNMAEESVENAIYNADIYNRARNKHFSSLMKVPFLGAMDAERGCGSTFPFFSVTTSNTGIGSVGDVKAAYDHGKYIASEIKACGVKWLWGPVCDNPSPFCSVSLTRGFSDKPDEIIEMTNEYVKGVQSEGVAATLKHFPGADRDEYRDSHFSDYAIRQNYEDWYERQGRVFKAGIDAGAYCVMVGHTVFPALDDTKMNGRYVPATLSRKMVTEVLKEKMGFKGVVITDAVGMRSLTAMFTNAEDFYAALYNAGNDVILGPNHIDFIDIVEKAVLNGKIPMERIDDACERVLELKEKLGLWDEDYDELALSERESIRDETAKMCKEYAPKSISWMSRKNNLVPVKKEEIKKVAVCYIGYTKLVLDALENHLRPEFEKRGASVTIFEDIKNAAHMKEVADNNDLILYVAHIAPHQPYGMGGFVMEKASQFTNILSAGAEKSICISTGSPFIYNDWFPAAENFLNLYCICPEYFQALVEGIYGECELTGTCSYNADPLAPRL